MTSSRRAETLSWPSTFSATSTRSRNRARGLAVFRGADCCGGGSPSRTVDCQADQAPRPSSAIVRVARENGAMPASIAQERLWKLQHALPDMPFFNVLYALRLTSACDVAVLERSINEIVRRHEILRTTFAAYRRSMRAGHCAAVDRAAGDSTICARCRVPRRRLSDTRSFKKRCFIPSTSRRGP